MDVAFSFSQSAFAQVMKDSEPSNLRIEKDGTIKLSLNVIIQLNVETSPGKLERARTLYTTLAAEMQIEDIGFNPYNRKLSSKVKEMGIAKLVVLKGSKSMEMEANMIKSLATIQLKPLKKKYMETEYLVNLGMLRGKILMALGCDNTLPNDAGFIFRDGAMQISIYAEKDFM